MSEEQARIILAQTARWISLWVIDQGLCPFAKEPWESERVRLAVTREQDLEGLLLAFQRELALIDASSAQQVETCLLVCPNAPSDFLDFLDLQDMANGLLEAQGLADFYQTVSFHPEYCFEGASSDDPANATNRSPYPTIQILRQSSVNSVLASLEDPSSIYKRNIAHLRAMDPQRWAMLQEAMLAPDKEAKTEVPRNNQEEDKS